MPIIRSFFCFLFCSFSTLLQSQCLVPPSFPNCTGTESLVVNAEVLNSGDTKWFYGGATSLTDLRLNGGRLIVCGDLTVDRFYMDSGMVYIQPGARFVIGGGLGYGLQLKGNCAIYNFGTLECVRNLSLDRDNVTASTPNILINASASSFFKMSNQYFVINSPYSWFVNNGRAEFHGLITDPQSVAGSVCLGNGSETDMTVLYNKIRHSYIAPSGTACLRVTQFSQFYDTLTADPGIRTCLGPTHRTDSACIPWGCKPNAWGAANLFRNCNSCMEIQLLPFHFRQFKAVIRDGKTELKWEMNTGTEPYQYSIERSPDGKHFISIQTINSFGGPILHTFDELPLPGKNYYRIICTNPANKASITSEAIHVNNDVKSESIVYPNPLKDILYVQLPVTVSKLEISLTDPSGRLIQRYQITNNKNRIVHMKVPENLHQGIYMVTVRFAGQQLIQKLVRKN